MSRAFCVSSLLAAALLAGCTATPPPKLAAPAPPPPPVPMPVPPPGASDNLTIPARLADGSYATPNRAPTPAAATWHLRAGLNVAALSCDDAQGTMAAAYSRLLAAHRASFASAYRTLEKEHAPAGGFDSAMTRLYNYYAQPAVKPGFCQAARTLLDEAAAVAPGTFDTFAAQALPRLDRPFIDFYQAYDGYRAELAAWRAGTLTAPRLAYDPGVFAMADSVTGGEARRLAAR